MDTGHWPLRFFQTLGFWRARSFRFLFKILSTCRMSWGIDDLLKVEGGVLNPIHSFLYLPGTLRSPISQAPSVLNPCNSPPPPPSADARSYELMFSRRQICMHWGMVTWGSNQPALDYEHSNIEYDRRPCAYLIVDIPIKDFCILLWSLVYRSNVAYLCCTMQDSEINHSTYFYVFFFSCHVLPFFIRIPSIQYWPHSKPHSASCPVRVCHPSDLWLTWKHKKR